MRLNYSRFLKYLSFTVFFVFLAEFFLERPALRSNIDLERQIDLAFDLQEKIDASLNDRNFDLYINQVLESKSKLLKIKKNQLNNLGRNKGNNI